MAIGTEVGRRLSVKELGFDKASILKLVLANELEQHFLARFVGQATGIRPYKIKEGDRAGEIAFGLLGMFEGTNSDGEVKGGSVLYLPGYVNDMIVAVLQSSEDVASVRIAFDVYAKYDADAATSYVFTANDLLNTGSVSVDEIKESIKALPMPSKTLALTGGKSK
jgi:hypothetical protein